MYNLHYCKFRGKCITQVYSVSWFCTSETIKLLLTPVVSCLFRALLNLVLPSDKSQGTSALKRQKNDAERMYVHISEYFLTWDWCRIHVGCRSVLNRQVAIKWQSCRNLSGRTIPSCNSCGDWFSPLLNASC